MTEHSFTLVIAGDVDAHLDELYERACDDATFGTVDGVQYGDFDRTAPTFFAAVTSAIETIESIPDLHVLRVEPDDLVTAAEIAERLGRTRESIRLLVSGRRGPGGFPAPVSHLRTRNRLWRWVDVAAWAGTVEPDAIASARFIAAINAALELRMTTPLLPAEARSFLIHLERNKAS